jgi:hypothetical protein
MTSGTDGRRIHILKPFIYGPGPSRKPDSALSRHPSPGLLHPGLPGGAAPTSPADSRDNLACSHRWFTWPVPRGIPPVGSYPTLSPITCAGGVAPLRPSAGLLSVALDVAAGLRRAAPRVLGPSGLSGPGSSRALASPDFALHPWREVGTQRRVGRPRPSPDYTLQR